MTDQHQRVAEEIDLHEIFSKAVALYKLHTPTEHYSQWNATQVGIEAVRDAVLRREWPGWVRVNLGSKNPNWPSRNTPVLARNSRGLCFEAIIDYDAGRNDPDAYEPPAEYWRDVVHDEALCDDEVTHWMPLPQPPKEGV